MSKLVWRPVREGDGGGVSDTFRSHFSNWSRLSNFSSALGPILKFLSILGDNSSFVRSRTIKTGYREILCPLYVAFLTAVPLQVKTSVSDSPSPQLRSAPGVWRFSGVPWRKHGKSNYQIISLLILPKNLHKSITVKNEYSKVPHKRNWIFDMSLTVS